MTEVPPVQRSRIGFILSLLGGIVDAAVALLLFPAYIAVQNINSTSFPNITPTEVAITAIIGLLLAIVVIFGAFMIHRPGREMIGSIVVIVFSILGLFYTSGGLYLGLVLGLIGGVLGFLKK